MISFTLRFNDNFSDNCVKLWKYTMVGPDGLEVTVVPTEEEYVATFSPENLRFTFRTEDTVKSKEFPFMLSISREDGGLVESIMYFFEVSSLLDKNPHAPSLAWGSYYHSKEINLDELPSSELFLGIPEDLDGEKVSFELLVSPPEFAPLFRFDSDSGILLLDFIQLFRRSQAVGPCNYELFLRLTDQNLII